MTGSQTTRTGAAARTTILCTVSALALATSAVHGDEIYNALPGISAAGDGIVAPALVTGKEYSNIRDLTHTTTPHTSDPMQTGVWDGFGGAADGRDFSGPTGVPPLEGNVDAMASINDLLFQALMEDRATLVLSTEGDRMLGSYSVASERSSATGGGVAGWALPTDIVNHPHDGPQLDDLDAIELWGPNGAAGADTQLISVAGEAGGTSVFYYNTTLQTLSPYISTVDILLALDLPTAVIDSVDVDALMSNGFDGEFDDGDRILFSTRPIADLSGGVLLDGGEIWLLEFGQSAVPLSHAGHLWDTAFNVSGTFNSSENIDAIEAIVPEPATAAILLVPAVLMMRRRS